MPPTWGASLCLSVWSALPLTFRGADSVLQDLFLALAQLPCFSLTQLWLWGPIPKPRKAFPERQVQLARLLF